MAKIGNKCTICGNILKNSLHGNTDSTLKCPLCIKNEINSNTCEYCSEKAVQVINNDLFLCKEHFDAELQRLNNKI